MTEINAKEAVRLNAAELDAAIFDMDGVVTKTATVHAQAWKRLFDEYMAERVRRGVSGYQPFNIDLDYRLYVDGRPRYDGVEAFLRSRGISLPRGEPDDPPRLESICGLGNRKDAYFLEEVDAKGVRAYPGTVRLIEDLKAAGIKVGIFSASRNAESILRAAGVIDLFDERVDGVEAERLGLPGKPRPDMLVELTKRLEAGPARAVVFEDAIAGVQAGHVGGFALVIGVNRGGSPGTLRQNGADLEVDDLDQVQVRP